jgi:hypothetical protein
MQTVPMPVVQDGCHTEFNMLCPSGRKITIKCFVPARHHITRNFWQCHQGHAFAKMPVATKPKFQENAAAVCANCVAVRCSL